MKTILTIMKKEFARIFKDRRIVLSLFLPGLLIYIVYSLIGTVIADIEKPNADPQSYRVGVVNLTDDNVKAEFNKLPVLVIEQVAQNDAENAKQRVTEGELDALVDFTAYNAAATPETPRSVAIYVSSVEKNSAAAGSIVAMALSPLQTTNFSVIQNDVASEKDTVAMLLSMVAPLLLMTFVFTGCLSLVPESIAGEKERGSFATMLVTPVKRSHIAIGKIIALSLSSLVSATCSFIGIVFSLPKMFYSEGVGLELSAAAYGVSDYLLLLFVVIATTLVIVALMSLISTVSKSVKEATSYAGPLMIVVVVAALGNIFLSEKIGNWMYFVPLFNSVKVMSEIFSFTAKAWQIIVSALSNLVAAAVLSFVLAKMFDSEKIVSGS